jgi:hypothetical protein
MCLPTKKAASIDGFLRVDSNDMLHMHALFGPDTRLLGFLIDID